MALSTVGDPPRRRCTDVENINSDVESITTDVENINGDVVENNSRVVESNSSVVESNTGTPADGLPSLTPTDGPNPAPESAHPA